MKDPTFDPYRKWLGIPEDSRPPTHYQLLSIQPGERDPDVIRAAVTQRSAYVRNFQAGKHADDATRLLNEIAAAEACVSNKEKRAGYDAELKRKDALKNPRPAPSPAAPKIDPLLEQAAAMTTLSAPWQSPQFGAGRAKQTNYLPLAIGGVAVVIVVVLGMVLASMLGGDDTPLARVEPPAADSDPPPENPSPAPDQSSSTANVGSAQNPVATDISAGTGDRPSGEGEVDESASAPIVEVPPPPAAIVPFSAEEARRHQQLWANYHEQDVHTYNGVQMAMSLIPPGAYLRGSPATETGRANTEGQSTVNIPSAFLVGQTEVTVAQFRAFAEATGYRSEPEVDGMGAWGSVAGNWVQSPSYCWHNLGEQVVVDSMPVTNVTWTDAAAFCAWLSQQEGRTYRLPSEDEWEFCCRAGSATAWSFGDQSADLAGHAWFGSNNNGYARAVGTGRPNGFGLFDLHGNAAEWSGDLDPASARPSGTVMRGGSYGSSPEGTRSASRELVEPNARAFFLGFRVVADVSPEASTANSSAN